MMAFSAIFTLFLVTSSLPLFGVEKTQVRHFGTCPLGFQHNATLATANADELYMTRLYHGNEDQDNLFESIPLSECRLEKEKEDRGVVDAMKEEKTNKLREVTSASVGNEKPYALDEDITASGKEEDDHAPKDKKTATTTRKGKIPQHIFYYRNRNANGLFYTIYLFLYRIDYQYYAVSFGYFSVFAFVFHVFVMAVRQREKQRHRFLSVMQLLREIEEEEAEKNEPKPKKESKKLMKKKRKSRR